MRSILFLILILPYFCFAKSIAKIDPSSLEIPQKAYTIQIYSSKDKEESREKGRRFSSFNQVFLWPKKLKKTTWYRVCVGVYAKKIEADEQLILLQEKYKDIPDALVVNLIND